MSEWIAVIMSFFCSLGFAVMFHVRGYKLILCGLGGSLVWGMYLLAAHWSGAEIFGFFAATFTVSLVSEILARVVKAPVILFLVPMLVPLIPGGDLYQATTYLVQNQMSAFGMEMALLAPKVGAMAFGIILMASLVQIYLFGKRAVNVWQKRKA
ncbi:threonine/serine exporter family protein [Alkalibacter rhizosphaerae]|uniref:Threonine/serine exporter family protein n=1 Tax=Alkalibacter rhizosphaerae TaxID=2815577 RepID=A0A974XGS5_9FIRM|nr:threonine/serine exporter family protein [Alkalibacter rhizosphaerae]QSX09411.1 threonine/serine exporter family protein [Alkalibacter rhizosphaerae]